MTLRQEQGRAGEDAAADWLEKAGVKAARAYLSASGEWDVPCRFDLVCVRDAGATFELDYYRPVFDISEIMGSGDAAWQPW